MISLHRMAIFNGGYVGYKPSHLHAQLAIGEANVHKTVGISRLAGLAAHTNHNKCTCSSRPQHLLQVVNFRAWNSTTTKLCFKLLKIRADNVLTALFV
jgi:hypothetical protein